MCPADRFVSILARLWQEHAPAVHALRDEARERGRDPHWPWNVFLMSMCTYGGSANYARQLERHGAALRWDAVCALSDADRARLFGSLPNPRFRAATTIALEQGFRRIREEGGPEGVLRRYEALATATARVAYWRSYAGVGAKYGRNIPMDVHDPLVQSHLALDHRLHAILDAIEGAPPRQRYREREAFLIGLGERAGIPGAWCLDRLLYSAHATLLDRMANAAPPDPAT